MGQAESGLGISLSDVTSYQPVSLYPVIDIIFHEGKGRHQIAGRRWLVPCQTERKPHAVQAQGQKG